MPSHHNPSETEIPRQINASVLPPPISPLRMQREPSAFIFCIFFKPSPKLRKKRRRKTKPELSGIFLRRYYSVFPVSDSAGFFLFPAIPYTVRAPAPITNSSANHRKGLLPVLSDNSSAPEPAAVTAPHTASR